MMFKTNAVHLVQKDCLCEAHIHNVPSIAMNKPPQIPTATKLVGRSTVMIRNMIPMKKHNEPITICVIP